MVCVIKAKVKYCGGGPGARRLQTPGQARAAIRKKRNRVAREAADSAEARRRGITVWQLRLKRAAEWEEVVRRAEREHQERLRGLIASSSRGYGRYW